MKCKECKYFKRYVFDINQYNWERIKPSLVIGGFCHRYPKSIQKCENDWCGEYKDEKDNSFYYEERVRRNISLKNMSEQIGISNYSLSQIENGNIPEIKEEDLEKVNKYYGVES